MSGASNPDAGLSDGVQTDGTLVIAVRPGGQPDAAWTGYTGWTATRITTGIETVPADFLLEATDNDPTSDSSIDIQPGYECFITIGGVTVLTGYVDRVAIDLSPTSHTMRISGRSKCADLVDCSAEFSTFQLFNTNPLSLASLLCQPFGITASAAGDIGATAIPQFDVILTETAFEIIERVARYAAILAYDGPDGNLILSRAGSASMASGFTQGVNVQQAYANFTMDERFSSVETVLLSTDVLLTMPGAPSDTSALGQDAVQGAVAVDLGVPRHRPLILFADQGDLEYQVAQQRCQWEVSRRVGRSQQITVVCDSWFDAAGALWTKNTLAPIDLPALKVTNAQWLIGSVTFMRNEQGTTAELTLMPPAAFLPEPIILQPYDSDVYQATHPNGGAAATDGGVGSGLPGSSFASSPAQ